jgi:hypothetical protein
VEERADPSFCSSQPPRLHRSQCSCRSGTFASALQVARALPLRCPFWTLSSHSCDSLVNHFHPVHKCSLNIQIYILHEFLFLNLKELLCPYLVQAGENLYYHLSCQFHAPLISPISKKGGSCQRYEPYKSPNSQHNPASCMHGVFELAGLSLSFLGGVTWPGFPLH